MIHIMSTPVNTKCDNCHGMAMFTLRLGSNKESFCTSCLARLASNLVQWISQQLLTDKEKV
jgi:formylmethanofuran dehydrogenase subunit E